MAEIVTIDGTRYVLADDGTAYAVTFTADAPAAPAAQKPAEPTGAMPFEIVTASRAGTAANPWPASMKAAYDAAPENQRQQAARQAAALNREPGYACDATSRLVRTPDGAEHNVGHGFIRHLDSGTKCRTAGCNGKIL